MHARRQGAAGTATVLQGDARQLAALLDTRGCSPASLILTSPPYACQIADLAAENVKLATGCLRREDTTNYSRDRSNLGHARGSSYLAAMHDVYSACATVLKPGGYMVIVTKDMRTGGALRNLSGETIALCQQLGLAYCQRVIALHATLSETRLTMRPSFWQTLHTRRAHTRGERTLLTAHEDVLIFRKPAAVTATQSAPAQKAALAMATTRPPAHIGAKNDHRACRPARSVLRSRPGSALIERDDARTSGQPKQHRTRAACHPATSGRAARRRSKPGNQADGSRARPHHRGNSGCLPVFHSTYELLVAKSDEGRTQAQLSAIRALLSSDAQQGR